MVLPDRSCGSQQNLAMAEKEGSPGCKFLHSLSCLLLSKSQQQPEDLRAPQATGGSLGDTELVEKGGSEPGGHILLPPKVRLLER